MEKDLEKDILRGINEKYGKDVILNPKKLRAHLLDRCVNKKRVNLLVDISRVEYFKKFMDEITVDESARQRLIYNTEKEFAFERSAVVFGVNCWAHALCADVKYPQAQYSDGFEGEIWPEEKAELVAAALRELLK